MDQKYLVGLLLALGVFLLTRITKGRSSSLIKIKAPEAIKEAFDTTFKNSSHPDSVNNWLAVSKMETGGFNSKIFRETLNLWGMKHPKKRPTKASGKYLSGTNEWAKYDSLKDSVQDIILWMNYTKFPKGNLSLDDHLKEMKARGYFEEPIDQYTNLVKAWIQR